IVGIVLACGLLAVLLYFVLERSAHALRQRWLVGWLVALALGFVVISPFIPPSTRAPWRMGAYAMPTTPRLWDEFDTWLHIRGYRSSHRAAIARAQVPLRTGPRDFSALRGADVHLMLIESY